MTPLHLAMMYGKQSGRVAHQQGNHKADVNEDSEVGTLLKLPEKMEEHSPEIANGRGRRVVDR